MNIKNFLIDELSQNSSFSESDSVSSTSESESEDDISIRTKRTRIELFVESTVENYSSDEFLGHFRMRKVTIHKITEIITPLICTKNIGGWPAISAYKAFLMTVWYLANQETFRQISDRFNVTASAAHTVIYKVVDVLCDISSNFIKWPKKNQYREIYVMFEEKQGIIACVGAIDGSHIPIKRPQKDANDYVNRKGYHSILWQAVVDCNKMFMNIFCGEPGSMHDARLLRKSTILKKTTSDPNFFGNFFILGDSAYPSLPWLVPPFEDNGHLTENQIQFNYKHSSTRIVVENAFGLLKARFRRLHKFENSNVDFITKSVIAACVLHNICIKNDDIFDEIEDLQDDNLNIAPDGIIEELNLGKDRRNILFKQMYP